MTPRPGAQRAPARHAAGQTVTVVKLRTDGRVAMRYPGQVLACAAHDVVLEAFFNIDHYILPGGVELWRGDRFVELYGARRWYNIFQIHDQHDGRIKGWYCNISRPPRFDDGQISYIDLALDLLVLPNGEQIVLDEDEFEALDLSAHLRQKALAALAQLQALFGSPRLPPALGGHLVFPPLG